MKLVGIEALISLVVQFSFIWLAFKSIQGLHIERLFREMPKTLPLLIVLLSIAIGYTSANFFMSFFDSIRNLIYIVK